MFTIGSLTSVDVQFILNYTRFSFIYLLPKMFIFEHESIQSS